MAAKRRWDLEHISKSVNVLAFNSRGKSWHHDILCLSDIHFDNPHCDRHLLKRHLDLAVERDAPIIVVGDFFCAMQGKGDNRGSKADVRPEHQTANYLDSIVAEAIEWWLPYKNHLAIVGQGNHETSVLDRKEVDLIQNLCFGLRQSGGITQAASYASFLRVTLNANWGYAIDAYLHHGFGGGSQATRATNHWVQYMAQVRADVYLAGHTHWKEVVPLRIAELNVKRNITERDIHCVRLGTYKDEYFTGDALSGYHHIKGRGPRPQGGYFWRITKHSRLYANSFLTCD